MARTIENEEVQEIRTVTSDIAIPTKTYMEIQERYQWDLIDDIQGGTHAMRKAGEKWLRKHPKEEQAAFDHRLKGSYLFNGQERTITYLTSKPFLRPVVCDEDMDSDILEWTENVDSAGTDLSVFLREWSEIFFRFGIAHILVDYPRTQITEGEEAPTVAQAKEQNLRPYWVNVHPQNLIGWHSERVNGVEALTQIRILEIHKEPDGLWGEKFRRRVRVITPDYFEVYEETDSSAWVWVDGGPMTLGFIPLVTAYADRKGFMVSKPPLLDLTNLVEQHWNNNSDQQNILWAVRTPFLFGAGLKPKDEVVIGASYITRTASVDAKLTYVEHTGKAVEAGRQDVEDLKSDMRIYGAILLQRPGNVPATKNAIDKSESDSTLGIAVTEIESTANRAIEIVGKWLGKEKVGKCKINRDFGIITGEVNTIDSLDKMRARLDLSHASYLQENKRHGLLSDDFDVEEEVEKANLEKVLAGRNSEEFEFDEEEEKEKEE
ncbi:MAG: DUF4055 domain-containing protein [Candidatus Hodarchaeales archaeon]|jgi:hypothetical protein